MAIVALFQKLSPLLMPDLSRGYYALTGTAETDAAGAAPDADRLAVDLVTGAVHSGDAPPRDLFQILGFEAAGARLTGQHTVAFEIGTPGLVGRVVGIVLPDTDPITVNDRTLAIAGLTRAQVVALLVEGLAVVGQINARRSPDMLAADDNVGFSRIFAAIQVLD